MNNNQFSNLQKQLLNKSNKEHIYNIVIRDSQQSKIISKIISKELQYKLFDALESIIISFLKSVDFYIQEQNLTTIDEIYNLLNNKIIQRCKTEFTNIITHYTKENIKNNSKQTIKNNTENTINKLTKKITINKVSNHESQPNNTLLKLQNKIKQKKIQQKQIKQKQIKQKKIQLVNKTNYQTHYFYNLQKKWGGKWNETTQKKIIIKKKLMIFTENTQLYKYTIPITNNASHFCPLSIILPYHDNFELLLYIQNDEYSFPMEITKIKNKLIFYENNQSQYHPIQQKQLSFQLLTYNKKLFSTNHDVYTITNLSISNYNNDIITINIIVDKIHHFSNNNQIIIKNISIHNQLYSHDYLTIDNMKHLNNILNTKHLIKVISKNQIQFQIINTNHLHFLKNIDAQKIINSNHNTIGFLINNSTRHLLKYNTY